MQQGDHFLKGIFVYKNMRLFVNISIALYVSILLQWCDAMQWCWLLCAISALGILLIYDKMVFLSLIHVHNFNINIDQENVICLFRFIPSFVTYLIIDQLFFFSQTVILISEDVSDKWNNAMWTLSSTISIPSVSCSNIYTFTLFVDLFCPT